MSQQETKDMAKHFYRASAADFMKIPGSPIAYWVSKKILSLYENSPAAGDIADVVVGLQTGNNDRFMRFWFEIDQEKFEGGFRHTEETIGSTKKWVPYNKGGSYRKWYGNREYVVNWENNGHDIKAIKPRSVIRSPKFYFRESVTWSEITSSWKSFRLNEPGSISDVKGQSAYFGTEKEIVLALCWLNSNIVEFLTKVQNPTLSFQSGDFKNLPLPKINDELYILGKKAIKISKIDWDCFEISYGFKGSPLLTQSQSCRHSFSEYASFAQESVVELKQIENYINQQLIDQCSLSVDIKKTVLDEQITLSFNPTFRYGSGDHSSDRFQSDAFVELLSYSIGCMMGRYSLDKPGLILASQGETLQDYLEQIPSPSFDPDENAILPLTDQEWFPDDATNRFREFVRVVWGDEHLQENLDFVAESLCLHAIKAKRGESALDTLRRYLSTQFYKDHLRTYKKRPIYWLFSSGKQKAFECLVYLHRYNESTLARMRTEYVIPLSAKLNAYAEKLEQDKDASTSTAETKRLEKEVATLHKQQTELAEFDEKLRHYADQRISLDLDDGVKVNYGKFGDLLAEVKAVHG